MKNMTDHQASEFLTHILHRPLASAYADCL